ncbi:MAG: CDGSH iron-sulfur domain-containing protein [Planctomycetota bacterium]
MARIIRMEGTGPVKVEPQDKPVFVCACGLTKNFPFCDGSHKPCKDEAEGKTYRYNDDGTRDEVDA